MNRRVVMVDGSYREHGITQQMLDLMEETLREGGFEVERIVLRDTPIAFCTNCRCCAQQPGSDPGVCTIDDAMRGVIASLESADGYVFASPTNFHTVTALFKRFLERLTVYGYWPWGTPAPTYRKAERKAERKAALCVSSCAAPSLLARLTSGTLQVLKAAARCVGAKVVGTLYIGLIAIEERPGLGEGDKKRVRAATRQLIAALERNEKA